MELLKFGLESHHMEEFISFRNNLYPQDHPIHTYSDQIDHKELHQCFMLTDNGKTVARAALFLNENLAFKGQKVACLGSFECVNNEFYAMSIINEVKIEAQKQNANLLIGPMDGSTWHSYRFCDQPNDNDYFFSEPVHHQYYPGMFKAAGFKPFSKYLASKVDIVNKVPDDILKIQHHFIKQGITLRKIDMDNFSEEVKKIHAFSQKWFRSYFLYTAISEKDFLKKYERLKSRIIDDLVCIAEDNEGEIIGVFFCLPDHFDKNNQRVIGDTLIRDQSTHFKGLGLLMYFKMAQNIKSRGFNQFIHPIMVHDVTQNSVAKSYEGKPYRSYSLFAIQF